MLAEGTASRRARSPRQVADNWVRLKVLKNKVLRLSGDVIMPRYLTMEWALYPSWPGSRADSLMMLPIIGVRLGLGLRG